MIPDIESDFNPAKWLKKNFARSRRERRWNKYKELYANVVRYFRLATEPIKGTDPSAK